MSEGLPLMTGPLEADDDFNLTVIRTDDSVLLGRKKRGFGTGQLVVPGGKTRYYLGNAGVEVIPYAAEAAREASEETGLRISSDLLVQKGTLHIADEEDTKTIRLYEVSIPTPLAVSSDELEDLRWHPAETLPYEQMPEDYKLWFPHMLAGYAITAFLETESRQIVYAKVFRQRHDPLGRLEEVVQERTGKQ